MAPSKLREALGAAKDKTTIGLTRAASSDDVAADLEVAIVRATSHGECLPADVDTHVQEILTLTRYSRARVAACAAAVSRRLAHTRAWPVALKALALVHRLVAEGDPAFDQELFLAAATARSSRRRVLEDVARFFGLRARGGSSAWDFAAFVRAYAAYLDDRVKLRVQQQCREGTMASPGKWSLDGTEAWELVPGDEPVTETDTGELVARAQQLAHVLDRAIDCRPMGKARANAVVTTALRMLVRDSAATYCELTEVAAALVDRFAEQDTPGCVRVHAAFTGLAKTIDELDEFYYWCTVSAVCRPSDVPDVERVKQKKLDLMDEFIRNRMASPALRWSQSPPAPLTPRCACAEKDDVEAETQPASGEHKFTAANEEDNAGNTTLSAVDDDKMVDFLNLNEGTSPQSEGKEHGRQNLALTLLDVDGDAVEPAPKWVAFEDPFAVTARNARLVQSASTLPSQRAVLGGGGFSATKVLDGMHNSHADASVTATNARACAGNANNVVTQPPGATMLALPPSTGAQAGTGNADPFAASLAVPPPTYVQMADLQTRQRLLVERSRWRGSNSTMGGRDQHGITIVICCEVLSEPPFFSCGKSVVL